MKICQATIEQLNDVAFLFDRYRTFYRQTSDLDLATEFIRERLLYRDSVIFLAKEQDNPVGYTQLFPSWSSVSMQRVWILNDLYVVESHRNCGIAKALMSEAADYGRATNAARLVLATEVSNKIGQNLYEAMGYRQFNDFYRYVLHL